MTEAELKAVVVRMAHDRYWRVFSNPMVKNKRPVKGAEGYPDLTLARGGRVLWIELKQEAGVLSHEQMGWLRDLGPQCLVIRPSDLDSEQLALALA